MSNDTKLANFRINWTIDWDDFNKLHTNPVVKKFITAYNGVSLYWHAKFIGHTVYEETVLIFNLVCKNGPAARLDDVWITLELVKPDKKPVQLFRSESCKFLDFDEEWLDIEVGTGDPVAFRKQYGLKETEPLFCRVKLSIPIKQFSCTKKYPSQPARDANAWLSKLFENIEDPAKRPFSNVKLVSNDEKVFYCDKCILASQSDVFTAMFQFPTPEEANDEFTFPKLSSTVLKVLLEFIYTKNATITNFSSAAAMELADAAAQYGFKALLLICRAVLWNGAPAVPADCFDIIRFSDLHDELRQVKFRAFEVLAGKYEEFKTSISDVESCGGGARGSALQAEFNLFVSRRVEPWSITPHSFCRCPTCSPYY